MKRLPVFLLLGLSAVIGATMDTRAQALPASERVDPANTTNERSNLQID